MEDIQFAGKQFATTTHMRSPYFRVVTKILFTVYIVITEVAITGRSTRAGTQTYERVLQARYSYLTV